MAKSSYMPPWDYAFREGYPCVHCGNSETIVLSAPGASSGICEPCSAHVHWVWRLLPGEAPPVEASTRPQRVKVLAGKLYTPSADLPVVPEVAGCYQFAMVRRGDSWDLPSADVGVGDGTELGAVSVALAEAGLGSWPMMLEPLYTGYAPRGWLVRVYLARAWHVVSSGDPTFRPWPVSDHAGSAAGFYLALEQVFPLRLWKHMAKEPRPDAVSFKVRKGAVEYAEVQEKIRRGDKEADASCLDLLYQRMTDDERFVVKQLSETSMREAERVADEAVSAEVPASAEASGDDEAVLDEDDGDGEIPAEAFEDGSDK